MVPDLGLKSTNISLDLRERGSSFIEKDLPRLPFWRSYKTRALVLASVITLVVFAAWFSVAGAETGHTREAGYKLPPLAEPADNEAGIEQKSTSDLNVKLKSRSHTSGSQSTNSSSTSLTLNGQDIPVSGGNIEKHFTSDDGNSTVDISIQNNSSTEGSGM